MMLPLSVARQGSRPGLEVCGGVAAVLRRNERWWFNRA
jgi:hypothetical protein